MSIPRVKLYDYVDIMETKLRYKAQTKGWEALHSRGVH